MKENNIGKMEQVRYTPCTLCGEQGHSHSKCPSLSSLLKMGFYSGGGSSSHSHSDDDESNQFIYKNKMNTIHKWLLQVENIFICTSRGPSL